jgi:hypothetical protein
MLRRKTKTLFLKQERNTQNAIALLNYLKRIGPQQLMLRMHVFPKKFYNANTTTTTLLKKFFSQENSCSCRI